MSVRPLISFFKDIDKDDLPSVGGKGANLGEMWKAGFPVPNGFAVTVESYNIFLQRNDVSNKIKGILQETDVNNSGELDFASKKIEKLKEEAIRHALSITNGNIVEAAKRLQLGRATIYRLMEKYKIENRTAE